MTSLVHEIWESTEDGMVLHTCCLAGTLGAECRDTLPPNSRLLTTFFAACHFDAMTIYNEFLCREPYTTDQPEDYRTYPAEWLDLQTDAN